MKTRTALATLVGLALAQGATAQDDPKLRADNVPPEDRRGGTLVAGQHITVTHPIGTVASGMRNIAGAQLNAGLIRLNDDYEPTPYLATSWEFSDDGRAFSFELHPEARFHDGEDITCTDVAFSVKTSQENHPFKTMFTPVTDVTGGDSKSCTMMLDSEHPALLTALSPGLLPIIPEHVFNDGQDMQSHPRLTTDVVGSGPFKLVEWDGNDLIRFERNDDFFIEGLPYLDEIVIDIVADPSTLALGLESGQYDMASLWSGDDIVAAEANPNLKVIDKGFEAIGSIPFIQMNLRHPNLEDVRVRQALAYGYDFDQYNSLVYAGQHRRQCGGIQSQSPFYNPDAECYEHDIEKARALLSDAGYEEGDLTIEVSTYPGQLQTAAEVLKQQWSKIGVNVDIDMHPDEVTMLSEMTAEDSDYQIGLVGLWNWGDPVIGVHRSYNCDNRKVGVAFSNMSWYCNEEVDALLAEAGAELDTEKRKALYFQATDLINEDVPVIYASNEVWYTRMQQDVQNPPDGVWGWMDSWAETWIDR